MKIDTFKPFREVEELKKYILEKPANYMISSQMRRHISKVSSNYPPTSSLFFLETLNGSIKSGSTHCKVYI